MHALPRVERVERALRPIHAQRRRVLAAGQPRDVRRDQAERFCVALSPFAPHIAEELWHRLGHGQSIQKTSWPKIDPRYLEEAEFELVVQIKGKLRGKVTVPKDASKDDLERAARAVVAEQLDGQTVRKVIVVPGKFFDVDPGHRRDHIPSRLRNHVRISYGPAMETLQRGVDRLDALVRES